MSRNLLMNNLPENGGGVMPVTNGLICWLDGRDGKNQDTVWRDRSRNGNDFELRGFTFSGDDGWTGNNLKVNFNQVAIKENFSLPEEYTIEVDLFIDSLNIYQSTFFYFGDGDTSGSWRECCVRQSSLNHIEIMHSSISHTVNVNLKRYSLTIMGKGKVTYLYIHNNVQLNEVAINNAISDLTANFYLGCGCNFHRYCKARFNSVRVYNRILTEEEIKHNYEYEQLIQR